MDHAHSYAQLLMVQIMARIMMMVDVDLGSRMMMIAMIAMIMVNVAMIRPLSLSVPFLFRTSVSRYLFRTLGSSWLDQMIMVLDAGRRMHKEALAVSDALRTKSDGQASLVVFTSGNFSIISTILLLAVLEHVSITFAE